MQVHDELLVEVPEQEVEKVREILKHEMETPCRSMYRWSDVGVGENWMDAKP